MVEVYRKIVRSLMIERLGQEKPSLEMLAKTVCALPEPERTAMQYLCALEGHEHKNTAQIAVTIGRSEEETEQIVSRALELLCAPSKLINEEEDN